MFVLFDVFAILISGAILYLIALLAKSAIYSGSAMFDAIFGLPERSAAADAFLTFLFQSVIAVTVIVTAFTGVSNHSVLSLEILYFISLIMLILFHIIKSEGPCTVNTGNHTK